MSIIEKNKLYKRNIKVNYIYSFLQSMNITQGFWMIYLASKGMSLVQLGILEGMFHFVSFFMETPTGAVADIFGRKVSRILGRFFIAGYILLMLFGSSFLHFFLAFMLCAIGWNLESGAGDAMVYDSLLETGDEGMYMKVNGWTEVAFQVAQAVALVVGGWIAVRSYELLFSGQVFIVVASAATAIFFTETSIGRCQESQKPGWLQSFKNQYIDSYTTVKGNNRLIYLIILINALGVFTTTTFFYMQIFCKQNGMQESIMGGIFAVSCVLGAFGGIFAHRIEKMVKERGLMLSLPFIFMVMMWGMISFKTAVISFMFIGFFDSLMYVVYSDYINKLIPSSRRATLLSFSSMIFSFFMIFVFPIFGAISDHYGLEYGFLAIALVATAFAIANMIVLNPKRIGSTDKTS